jgi:hypothetical protein
MRARRHHCLCCGGPTVRDPGNTGARTAEWYCPGCDAVWRKAACVVCGETYLVDVTRHRGGHHCDPAVEERIEAGRRRQAVLARPHGHSVGARLTKGFRMWHEEER